MDRLATEPDNRILVVEVTDWPKTGAMQMSPYIFTVPYRSLAPTLQFIRCNGGKINRVTFLSARAASKVCETELLKDSVSSGGALIDPVQPPLTGVTASKAQLETSRSSNRLVERFLSMVKKIAWRPSNN